MTAVTLVVIYMATSYLTVSQRRGVVVTSLVVSTKLLYVEPVSTGMGDVSGFDSRTRHFISVCNQPPRSTRPFILSRSIN